MDNPGAGGGDAFSPNSTFFNQTDQDLQLIFLVNRAQYTQEVSDSWFSANRQIPDFGLGHTYMSHYIASVMGCLEQHQICSARPSGSREGLDCTPLTGRTALFASFLKDNGASIHLNEQQWATAYRLLRTIDETGLRAVLLELGASSLVANYYLDWQTLLDFTSSPLPESSWMVEVANWHNITLANLQRWTVDYSYGPADPEYNRYIHRPSTAQERAMCSNQRVRGSDAMSFNGLGVVIIGVIGSLIIVTNLSLPAITGFVQTQLSRGTQRRMEWALDETLQLQRIAYERSGQGTWRNTESIVPLSRRGEKFRHPRYFDGALYSPLSKESFTSEYVTFKC